MTQSRGRSSLGLVSQFVIFVAAGLVVTWPSLNYPWFGDDLHLIRVFTNEELRSVWTGAWDVDGLETVGYRPLTVVFNHARASVFGEHVMAHRLFLISLCAVYLVLIGLIGRRFGLTPAAMLLAGVMMLCAKYSSYHLVWIADGVHLAQGVAFAMAALAILRWIESGARRWWCASLLWFVLSVLVREDSLAIAPVLVGMAVLYGSTEHRLPAQWRGVMAYAAAILVISLIALVARQAVLTVGDDSPWTSPFEWIRQLVTVATLAGWQPLFLIPLFVLIFTLLAAVALRCGLSNARMAWFWLCCAAVSTAPAITMSRVNLLLFPVTFYCLFAADILTRWASGRVHLFGKWDRACAVVVACCCLALPAYESRRQQLSLAVRSISRLEAYCDIARGGPWAAVTPRHRQQRVVADLQQLGLGAGTCDDLVDEFGALKSNVRTPEGVFTPPQRFLSR